MTTIHEPVTGLTSPTSIPSSSSSSNTNGSSSNNNLVTEFTKWEDVDDLKQDLLRGIYAYGFEAPSLIQQRAILPIMQKKDVIAQAQSGTGKTGAFTVAALQCIDVSKAKTQAMIVAPTRELSRQIYDVVAGIGSMMKGLNVRLLIGGTSTEDDAADIKTNVPHVIVGCPGRIHDMFRRHYIHASDIDLFILDEADEMLSAGFKDQIYNIFQFLSRDVQVALFSATVPPELHTLAEKFMRNPVKILVKADLLTLEGIVQHYIAVDDDVQKYLTLKDLFKAISMSQCIIYCNSIKRVMDLYDAMVQDGFPVCCIHSGMDKDLREKAYKDFKNGLYRVLISSNVTARGIDIQQVNTVINFDLPRDEHTYLHRIGRSGRWGRKGVGINFVTRRDFRTLKTIETYYGTTITELPSTFCDNPVNA